MPNSSQSPPDANPIPQMLTGWGRSSRSAATVLSPSSQDELIHAVRTFQDRPLLARGAGRSYGDHLRWFDLVLPDGTLQRVTPGSELFAATLMCDSSTSQAGWRVTLQIVQTFPFLRLKKRGYFR